MRLSTFALIVLAGFVACAKTPQVQPNSGVQGTVTVGPQCPVVHVESPCPNTPFDGKVQVSQSGKGVIADVQVDSGGRYRIALEPGTYEVMPVLAAGGGPPTATPLSVVVRSGAFTRADLTVDTGIR